MDKTDFNIIILHVTCFLKKKSKISIQVIRFYHKFGISFRANRIIDYPKYYANILLVFSSSCINILRRVEMHMLQKLGKKYLNIKKNPCIDKMINTNMKSYNKLINSFCQLALRNRVILMNDNKCLISLTNKISKSIFLRYQRYFYEHIIVTENRSPKEYLSSS